MKPRRDSKRKRPVESPARVAAEWSPAVVAGALFVFALAARAIYLAQIADAPFTAILMGDAKAYDAWALQISAGDWIGHDVFYQAPLYPYFLGAIYAIAGHSVLAVRVAQAVLGSIAVVLIAQAASRLISRRAGLIAGIVAALYPTAIFFDGLIQKTALDAFLTAIVLWLLSGVLTAANSRGRWIALGVALAALSLTRENALALVLVVGIWSVAGAPGAADNDVRGRRMANTAAFVAGLALLLAPVALRNYAVGGGFYLTTSQFGSNLYLGNNPYTDGTAGSLIAGRGSAEYERQDATDIAERAAGHPLTPGEISSYWTSRTLAFIRAEPMHWARLMLRKTALLWNSYEAFDTESQESYAEYSTLLRALAVVGHFGILVPLAAAGVLVTWPQRRRLSIIYTIALTYAASVVLFFIYARYRDPLVPFLLLFASAALAHGFETWRATSGRSRGLAVAALAAIIVATNWPLLSASETRAVSEHNLAAALQSEGRADDAIAHYRRAIEIKKDYAPSYSNLGAALMAKGETGAAIDAYRQAIAIAPDLADAHFNLGNALMARGDAASAATEFERARELGGSAVDVETNLGLALSESGQRDAAIAALQRAIALSPNNLTAHYALGRAFLESQRANDAIEQLRIAASNPNATADMINDYGIALISSGRLDDAISAFERATAKDPQSVEARNNLAAARADRARAGLTR